MSSLWNSKIIKKFFEFCLDINIVPATSKALWNHAGNEVMHGAQIDLLIDRDDKVINIFELKYYDSKLILTKDTVQKMRNKIASFKYFTGTNKTIFPTIICPYGVQQNKYSNELVQSIVELDDLFE